MFRHKLKVFALESLAHKENLCKPPRQHPDNFFGKDKTDRKTSSQPARQKNRQP
jgi:hypothetical protein